MRARVESQTHPVEPNVDRVLADERRAGLDNLKGYDSFTQQVKETKFALLAFLLSAARQGRR